MTVPPRVLEMPRTKPRYGPKLRTASFKDYEQIAGLESRFGLPTKPYEEWAHLWQSNPAYRELNGDWPIGWVLEDENGKIVGSMGNIPFFYELDGRKILVASGRSWVADLAYRSASLVLLDNLIRQPNVDLYLNNTVGDSSVAAVTALECCPVPVGIWDETAYWITNYLGCFQEAMKNYVLTRPPAFPSWEWPRTHVKAMGARFSSPSNNSFWATALLRGHLAKASLGERDVEVKACPDFDDRFDNFWDDLKTSSRHLLLAVRTPEVLKWHFKHALAGNQLWIVTVVDGPRLIAYAIFKKVFNLRSGMQQVLLADYQSLENNVSMLKPLLSWTLKRCRSEGIHMLVHTGQWLEKGEFIDTAAPYRRKLSTWRYFYRANNPELRELLKDRQVWAPSLFDSDACL